MSWLWLTAISVVFRSVYGMMTKVLSNKLEVSVYTQAAVLSLAAVVLSLLMSPFFGGVHVDVEHVSWTAIGLITIGQGFGNITYFAAIKNLTGGTAQIAFSSILVFNTLLAVLFLSLHLSPVNVFGIVLLLLAITSVVSGKIELRRKGVLLMVLSALCFSVFQLSSSELSKQVGPATYMVIAYSGSVVVIALLKWRVIWRDVRKADRALLVKVPLLTALPSLGNFLFAYYAYRSAPEPAKVAMLLTAQVVLNVFLSYWFLKERGHLWRKVIAAVLVVVSAILIKS